MYNFHFFFLFSHVYDTSKLSCKCHFPTVFLSVLPSETMDRGFTVLYCHVLFWHLGRGHTKETGNRNTTVISENCYQPELNTLLNGAAQIEETMLTLPLSLVCPCPYRSCIFNLKLLLFVAHIFHKYTRKENSFPPSQRTYILDICCFS
jgi:hypothetical protein